MSLRARLAARQVNFENKVIKICIEKYFNPIICSLAFYVVLDTFFISCYSLKNTRTDASLIVLGIGLGLGV